MRERIKQIFLDSNHKFLSGEEISKKLKISRTAIWKQIEELKKEGYQFEAVRKKGYRLINTPDDISSERIKNGLDTAWLGRNIIYYSQTTSTQIDAQELAKNEAEHGTIVIANEQLQGKGRLGRSWNSTAGKGIWMSMIIRPNFGYQYAPLITLFTSLILKQTFMRLYGLEANIKWPNDIYINDKKCSGILTEMHGEQDQIHYLIIGIGINTKQEDYPEELKNKAISLQEVLSFPPLRTDIIQEFLSLFEKNYKIFTQEGFSPFFNEYNDSLLWKNKDIMVNQHNKKYEGKLEGIADNGLLLIRQQNGELTKVVSGDVEQV